MKLEEILPEIRKGRRFKRAGWKKLLSREFGLYVDIKGLSADDWELEPLPATKMKAWIESTGVVRMVKDEFHDSTPASMGWTRAEWLDPP